MKTRFLLLLLTLQISLFASMPVGSWEVDSEASLKNDPTFIVNDFDALKET